MSAEDIRALVNVIYEIEQQSKQIDDQTIKDAIQRASALAQEMCRTYCKDE